MTFNIRQAREEDMVELLRLRHERNAVYLKDNGYSEAAEESWKNVMMVWLKDGHARILVAEDGDHLLGYMIGWVRENLPQLPPEKVGMIVEMTVDGHNKQGGVGTALLDEMKTWFKAQHITEIEVRVPRFQAIEQAFWRSVGGREQINLFAYRLD